MVNIWLWSLWSCGSPKELKEAMTSTANHKLDLPLTVTARVSGDSGDDQWIISR